MSFRQGLREMKYFSIFKIPSIPTLDGEGLFVTGGLPFTLTSEYVFPNGTIKEGPNLRGQFAFHCLVRLNETTLYFIGGFNRHTVVRFSLKSSVQ